MSKSQNLLNGRMKGVMANFVTTTHSGENVIRAKAFVGSFGLNLTRLVDKNKGRFFNETTFIFLSVL